MLVVTKYIRTCQSCGHKQEAKDPNKMSKNYEGWRELKCKKCKSEDFDFGSYKDFDENGNPVEIDWT